MTHHHVTARPGESAPFHFESTWRVDAAPAEVWAVLADVDHWSEWWPGMDGILAAHDTTDASSTTEDPVGERLDIRVTSFLGVTLDVGLTITEADRDHRVTFTAEGDLRGSGQWTLDRRGPLTEIAILWCVCTRKPFLRSLRPVSRWTHSRVMSSGNQGLRDLLNRARGRH